MTDYSVGDRVWAKMKGYPHWPARVRLVRSIYNLFYDATCSVVVWVLGLMIAETALVIVTVGSRTTGECADPATKAVRLFLRHTRNVRHTHTQTNTL